MMHSSSRPSVPPRPRRFDSTRRVEQKAPNNRVRKEDKNMNTSINTVSSSPRRASRGPPEASRLKVGGPGARASPAQPKVVRQQKNNIPPGATISKPKGRKQVVENLAPAAVDPNCNEPSLPCLCCDGHSPQDGNSLFNHNHNNNNTVTIRHQLQLQLPPLSKDTEAEQKLEVEHNPQQEETMASSQDTLEDDKVEKRANMDDKEVADQDEGDFDIAVCANVDVNGNGKDDSGNDDDNDDDDDEDDDTLVPSCCDCPASMLEFSLTSSTSSSSTSISSCSDLECDFPDNFSLSSQDQEITEHCPSSSPISQPQTLPLALSPSISPPLSPCSPDEGYPSGPSSPSSDFLQSTDLMADETTKMDLLNFLDSMDELGKVNRFYRMVQVARWELEGVPGFRDRLNHLDRLEKVHKQVKVAHLVKLQEAGLDLDEEDISDVLDEMGNVDISWKFYKGGRSCDSQDFSDAGVDLTAPSDTDEPFVPDSLAPSPLEPPPRPPKPPARNVSTQLETHTYINISRDSTPVPSTVSSTASLNLSVSPVISSPLSMQHLEKDVSEPVKPPPSQPVPYFSHYSASPTLASPTPPIPPPRRRRKARLEAQRRAELLQEKSPLSLPPPTSRPPPLPPPPVSSSSSPPAIPPPPSLPPPPSFHALDAEIRKLLVLAGLTQAELLKLSPELGACVEGVLEDGEKDISEESQLQENKLNKEISRDERECSNNQVNSFGKEEWFGIEEVKGLVISSDDEATKDEQRETNKSTFKTTSFTEMARRRKHNGGSTNTSCSCGYSANVSISTDSYYSTNLSNINTTYDNFESLDYASVISDIPPPPPPRPSPPRPPVIAEAPDLTTLKPCTLSANASRPDRFDWLIAFTPDTETLPLEMKNTTNDITLQKSSGPKVTTFKELRHRNKQNFPPAPVQPEPDPTVITPDPDFLYNLKWRREKIDGDGNQWEYTSQAEATFLQPPPTPASLALFREMRHLNIGADKPVELNLTQRLGCSASESNLWTVVGEREKEGQQRKQEVEDRVEAEARGRADGGRTAESRITVFSPPLPLALPYSLPSPYFLHSTHSSQIQPSYPPQCHSGHAEGSPLHKAPRDTGHHTDPTTDAIDDSLYADSKSNVAPSCCHGNDPSNNTGSTYSRCTDPCYALDSLYRHNEVSSHIVYNRNNYGNSSITNLCSSYGDGSDSDDGGGDSFYDVIKDRRKNLQLSFNRKASVSALNNGNVTPYKNIDMLRYVNAQNPNLAGSPREAESPSTVGAGKPGDRDSLCDSLLDLTVKERPVPDTRQPTFYLYHPKNCPLHKGAPPRLSPVGAVSPPLRSGPPAPGVDVSRLSSPLFPRSHTLPALAAPLYYPYLYTPPTPPPPSAPPAPQVRPQQSQTPFTLTVRSLSFAGSVQRGGAWMGDDAGLALRDAGHSSLCLQEKKALVSAVSVSVEAILSHFSSSRTLVQKSTPLDKTLSGDSSVNPSLGRLVLQCLCPALRSLLCDGLKPHQSDLIAGRRPNSPWGLVQASTKPGPGTQALHSLQARVSHLPQLRQSRHRFNAFLLGLLNIKLLDYWISHLQTCGDVLETYYRPTSFMRLSLTSCQPLFEELLLLLQPLSLLTFNLDLLFQHHHLDPTSPSLTPANHSPEISSPPNKDFAPHVSPKGPSQSSGHHLESLAELDLNGIDFQAANGVTKSTSSDTPVISHSPERTTSCASKGGMSPQLQWLQEKEIAPPSVGGMNGFSQQAGQALQQGWGAVMRFGERLGQNWEGFVSSGSASAKGPASPDDMKPGTCPDAQKSPEPTDGSSLMESRATVPWGLSRLFGASKSPLGNPPTHTPPSRRPSHWLSPGVSALTRMVSASPTIPTEVAAPETSGEEEREKNEEEGESDGKPRPLRAVKTLCDHTGTGEELSFQKGEELVVLGGVDQDWIRCRQGDKEGLVPIGYTSLIM